jgi:gluconokinase
MDCVLTIDVGSSSARTLLFDFDGRQVDGFGSQLEYRANTTADGGWEIDADQLTATVVHAVDAICEQMRAKGVGPAAVGVDTFWHSLVGVDAEGLPTTPILHPFDTRSAAAAEQLRRRVDNRAQHARTGCMLHPSYPPAKLLWLAESQTEAVRTTKRWMSAGEFLFLKLLGKAAASTSMVSATGMWDQNRNAYDPEMMAALPVSIEQFAAANELDQPVKGECRWPKLSGIPWYPALGDGACDNLGSGCVGRDSFALMVGTSGAMRAIVEADRIDIPEGLFCYRLDPKRFVLGGALSNGGAVFAWMKRTLCLPSDNKEIERQLTELPPAAHGLTVLPLFAGERSTGWRLDARAAISGLSTHTSPMEILQAGLEAVALRFRNVYELMEASLGAPRELVASGTALLHSRAWTQMMADTLGRAVVPCLEPEATSRGAALMALERLGVRVSPAAQYGGAVEPVEANRELYMAELARQRSLYGKLF